MTTARDLYELREIDVELDGKKAALVAVEGQIGESEAVAEAKRCIEEMRCSLDEWAKQQHEEEWASEQLRLKAKEVEDKLYGGMVRNPKELASLQEDLDQLKAQQRPHDDLVLDLMARSESLQGEVENKLDEIRRMEAEWYQEQQRLFEERDRLKAEIEYQEKVRIGRAALIDRESLALYESLRGAKQGIAVAKVERGMCQGCRISLPMNELQRARSGRVLVQCGSCGRILYVS